MRGSVERPGEKRELQLIWTWIDFLLILLTCILFCVCRSAKKKDEEKQRSYKQKKKRRRIKVQDSSSSNEKVFKCRALGGRLELSQSLFFFCGRICQVEKMDPHYVYQSSHA